MQASPIWSAISVDDVPGFLNQFSQADGYLARRFKTQTVLGTILDPAADKALVTTLAVTLTMKGLLPRQSFCSLIFPLISSHVRQCR